MRCNPYHSLQQQSNQQSKHFSHVSESLPSSPLLLPLSLLLLLLLLVLHLLNQPSLFTTMIQLWIFSSSSSSLPAPIPNRLFLPLPSKSMSQFMFLLFHQICFPQIYPFVVITHNIPNIPQSCSKPLFPFASFHLLPSLYKH